MTVTSVQMCNSKRFLTECVDEIFFSFNSCTENCLVLTGLILLFCQSVVRESVMLCHF